MNLRETMRDYWPRLSNAAIDDAERILAGESERDAVAIIQRIAEQADGAPTPAKVAEHLRAVRAERAAIDKAAQAHRVRERDEAHFRLVHRMRERVSEMDAGQRSELFDAVLQRFPMGEAWMGMAYGWAKRAGHADTKAAIVVSQWMAPITAQYLIEQGELDDREGAFERTPEELAAGDEADRLIEAKRRRLAEAR